MNLHHSWIDEYIMCETVTIRRTLILLSTDSRLHYLRNICLINQLGEFTKFHNLKGKKNEDDIFYTKQNEHNFQAS